MRVITTNQSANNPALPQYLLTAEARRIMEASPSIWIDAKASNVDSNTGGVQSTVCIATGRRYVPALDAYHPVVRSGASRNFLQFGYPSPLGPINKAGSLVPEDGADLLSAAGTYSMAWAARMTDPAAPDAGMSNANSGGAILGSQAADDALFSVRYVYANGSFNVIHQAGVNTPMGAQLDQDNGEWFFNFLSVNAATGRIVLRISGAPFIDASTYTVGPLSTAVGARIPVIAGTRDDFGEQGFNGQIASVLYIPDVALKSGDSLLSDIETYMSDVVAAI